jgi:L-asparagine transporter-like permease
MLFCTILIIHTVVDKKKKKNSMKQEIQMWKGRNAPLYILIVVVIVVVVINVIPADSYISGPCRGKNIVTSLVRLHVSEERGP